jgi:hypothetical protein
MSKWMTKKHNRRVWFTFIWLRIRFGAGCCKCGNKPSVLRSALFWVITQRRVVILYRRFGAMYRSQFQGSRKKPFLTVEHGTDTLSRNVGKGLSLDAALYPRRAQTSSASRRKPEITTLGFHKILGISRLAEDLLASQGVLQGVSHTVQQKMMRFTSNKRMKIALRQAAREVVKC